MTPTVRRASGEDGLTLVEVVVTVAILGVSFVAILGGLWTAIVTSDTHRQQTLATTYLINAAEYLKSTDTTAYVPCAAAYSLAGLPATSVPADWKAGMTVTVRYWTGTTFSPNVADCLASTTSLTLQEVGLSVTSPITGRATETLSFVKRPG